MFKRDTLKGTFTLWTGTETEGETYVFNGDIMPKVCIFSFEGDGMVTLFHHTLGTDSMQGVDICSAREMTEALAGHWPG